MPTSSEEIIDKGTVILHMLSNIGLKDIQIRLLPAKQVFNYYLEDKKFDIEKLKL